MLDGVVNANQIIETTYLRKLMICTKKDKRIPKTNPLLKVLFVRKLLISVSPNRISIYLLEINQNRL